MKQNNWDDDKNKKLIRIVTIVAMVTVFGCIVVMAFVEKNKRKDVVMQQLTDVSALEMEKYLEQQITEKVNGKVQYNSSSAHYELVAKGANPQIIEEGMTLCVLNTNTLMKQYGQVKYDFFKAFEIGRGWSIDLYSSNVPFYDGMEVELVKFS